MSKRCLSAGKPNGLMSGILLGILVRIAAAMIANVKVKVSRWQTA
jgi:hypothetical protein